MRLHLHTSECSLSQILSMPTASFWILNRRANVKSLTISNPALCVLCAVGSGNSVIEQTRSESAQE